MSKNIKVKDSKKTAQLKKNHVDGNDKPLTSRQGVKVNDTNNSLKLGERGSTLLEDFLLREKITSFDHERIPERIVHARGSGAHGYFELYESQENTPKLVYLLTPKEKRPFLLDFQPLLVSEVLLI